MATTISQAFNEFKSKLELSKSFQEKITTHHKAIRDWIESYDPKIETKLIGSLQRKTRIQPRSNDTFDIDILVILGKFHRIATDGSGVSPSDAINKVHKIMKGHGTYEKMNPSKDYPTVYIKYSDGTKVELVPAYKDFIYEPKGQGYRIPKSYYEWTFADYDYDAGYISNKNRETGGYLIPTIKMLKAAKRNLFPKMKSYHLEVLAANIIPIIVDYWKNRGYSISFPFLVYRFFCIAKDEILKPVKIQGSKSPNADSYSIDKNHLANTFEKICNYCDSLIKLDDRKAIEGWRKLFGEPFPTYG